MRVWFVVGLVFFGLSGLACVSPRPQASAARPGTAPFDDVVAWIGSTPLYRSVLDGLWRRLDQETRRVFEARGGKAVFLRDLASKKRIALDAARKKIDSLPEARLDLFIARDTILFERYLLSEIAPLVVSEVDIKTEYEKRRERFKTQLRYRARHILVSPQKDSSVSNRLNDDATTDDEATAKIAFLERRIGDGADFAVLANDYSEDQTAAKGGDLGWFGPGTMVPAFEEAVRALPVGGTSHSIKTEYGYHLIRLEEREEDGYAPFDSVRDALLRELLDSRAAGVTRELEKRQLALENDYPLVIVNAAFSPPEEP